MNPNLDTQLRAYLEAWQNDQSSGNTIANLRIELHQVKLNVEELTTQNTLLRMRLDRHGQEIRMIKQHLALNGSEGEDTGQHQVEDLKRALASREKELEKHAEEGRWWKRKAVGWIVAIAAWVLTSIAAVAAWAVTHPSPPNRETPTFERGSR